FRAVARGARRPDDRAHHSHPARGPRAPRVRDLRRPPASEPADDHRGSDPAGPYTDSVLPSDARGRRRGPVSAGRRGLAPRPPASGAGAAPGTRRASATMTALLSVTVITRIGAESLRATLNARFSFVGPAAMPLVENGTVLVVMLALHRAFGVRAVAIGYVV